MKSILFDIDGCIIPSPEAVAYELRHKYRIPCDENVFVDYNVYNPRMPKEGKELGKQLFRDCNFMLNLKCRRGFPELSFKLNDMGWRQIVATGRFGELGKLTKDYVCNDYLPKCDKYYLESFYVKEKIGLKEKCILALEDTPNIIDNYLVKTDMYIIVPEQEYNLKYGSEEYDNNYRIIWIPKEDKPNLANIIFEICNIL